MVVQGEHSQPFATLPSAHPQKFCKLFTATRPHDKCEQTALRARTQADDEEEKAVDEEDNDNDDDDDDDDVTAMKRPQRRRQRNGHNDGGDETATTTALLQTAFHQK